MRAMILMPLALLALTTRSASDQSYTPLPAPSIKRHWNSVFCQWKFALVAIFRSRSVVGAWFHRNMLRPKSGLETGGGGGRAWTPFGFAPTGEVGRGISACVWVPAVTLPVPLAKALPNVVLNG